MITDIFGLVPSVILGFLFNLIFLWFFHSSSLISIGLIIFFPVFFFSPLSPHLYCHGSSIFSSSLYVFSLKFVTNTFHLTKSQVKPLRQYEDLQMPEFQCPPLPYQLHLVVLQRKAPIILFHISACYSSCRLWLTHTFTISCLAFSFQLTYGLGQSRGQKQESRGKGIGKRVQGLPCGLSYRDYCYSTREGTKGRALSSSR